MNYPDFKIFKCPENYQIITLTHVKFNVCASARLLKSMVQRLKRNNEVNNNRIEVGQANVDGSNGAVRQSGTGLQKDIIRQPAAALLDNTIDMSTGSDERALFVDLTKLDFIYWNSYVYNSIVSIKELIGVVFFYGINYKVKCMYIYIYLLTYCDSRVFFKGFHNFVRMTKCEFIIFLYISSCLKLCIVIFEKLMKRTISVYDGYIQKMNCSFACF